MTWVDAGPSEELASLMLSVSQAHAIILMCKMVPGLGPLVACEVQ